jgi:hypothetical protein
MQFFFRCRFWIASLRSDGLKTLACKENVTLAVYDELQSSKGARVKTIHLIIAVLALSLFGIVGSDFGLFSGLSLATARALGFIAFGANMAIGVYGVVISHRIAWSAYLALSVAGLVLVGATTPIVAVWLALKLL